MAKWDIYVGSVDVASYIETTKEMSRDKALEIAYEYAKEDYDSFAGLHGIRDIDEIMDEEGVDDIDAWEIYEQEREVGIEYYIEENKEKA